MENGIRIDVYHHISFADEDEDSDLAARLEELEEIVSELSDRVSALDKSFDDMKARVQQDITRLQEMIANGGTTPDVLASLDDLKAKIDNFAPVTPEPNPPVPVPAPETPTPTPAPTVP